MPAQRHYCRYYRIFYNAADIGSGVIGIIGVIVVIIRGVVPPGQTPSMDRREENR